VGAVWYRARGELRRRWRSTLGLALLAGLVGGVVIASAAGARRTSSAMDRFVAFNRAGDLFVEHPPELDVDRLADLPQVVSTSQAAYVLLAPVGPDGRAEQERVGTINPFLLIPVSGEPSNVPLMIDGRVPDPDAPLETMVDEELAEARHLEPGDTLRMVGFAEDQLDEISGVEAPRGPAMDFTVTGIYRRPDDVVPRPSPKDVVYLGTQDMLLGPAWYERYAGQVAMFGPEGALEVRLRHGASDVDAFERELRRLPGGEAALLDTDSDAAASRKASNRSVRFGVAAIGAFGALVALTGLVLIGQALARSLALEADDAPALRALGMGPGALTAVAGVRVLSVAIPAAVLAVAVAVGLSPLFPISLARRAEVDPGVDVDLPVLLLGALAVVVVTVAWGICTGLRLAHGARGARPAPPSRLAARLAEAGAPPPVVTGARLALQAGRGRSAVVGLGLAVVVAVAAATFGRSLDRLIDTPALQGWNWDVSVGNGQEEPIDDLEGLLRDNPLVGGYSAWMAPFPIRIDGEEVDLAVIGSGDGPTNAVVEGRAPTAPGEIALGDETLRDIGARIGDRVEVAVDTVTDVGAELDGEGELTVVGTSLFNDAEENQTELGQGALVTFEGAEAMGIEPFVSRFLVDYAPGVDEGEAFRSLQADFGRTVVRPVPAVDVENLRRVSGMPALLACLVALLAVAFLSSALFTTLRRRRRDLAVLRALGFLRRQLGATVLAFATTTVVLAVAVGTPLGIGIGRWAWQRIADSLGSPAPPVVPVPIVLAVAAALLLVAAAVAAAPARSAAATEPALVLRSE
jgi:hypothetical protein